MSLELQSLAVFGLSPKAQKFFLFFLGRNWRNLFGSLVASSTRRSIQTWLLDRVSSFSRFSLPDWLTSTIGQDTHPPGGFNSGPSGDALRI